MIIGLKDFQDYPFLNQSNPLIKKVKLLFVAFSTQKGGVGKTTFTVLAASYLYYLKGYQVAVVDCDYPQHSINAMRKRDAELINSDEHYKRLAFNQFKTLEKKAYPIWCTSPENAIETANTFIESGQTDYDIIFFDLPETVNSEGVAESHTVRVVTAVSPKLCRSNFEHSVHLS